MISSNTSAYWPRSSSSSHWRMSDITALPRAAYTGQLGFAAADNCEGATSASGTNRLCDITLVHGRFSRKRTNRDRAPIVCTC